MSVRYSKHLFIRVDRPLRADLLAAAEAAGTTVSHAAREILRAALVERGAARNAAGSIRLTDREAA